jgi:hypothetical protein
MADGHADVIALGLALAATVSTVCITNRAGSFRASAAPAPAR